MARKMKRKTAKKKAAAPPMTKPSDVVHVDPGTGAVTKGRTPLTDLVSASMVKRLQDNGYVIVHQQDQQAKPLRTAAVQRAKAARIKKKKAARRKRGR